MPKNQFTSERQPARKGRRGPDKKTLLVNALREQSMDEQDFYTHLVKRALDSGDQSSAMLLKEIMTRVYPASRPVMPMVDFDFPSTGTAADKVDAIAQAISEGVMPADVGKIMTDVIKTGIDIREASEMQERIEALEKAINGGA